MKKIIKPPLKNPFNKVYNRIKMCFNSETPRLVTTGGCPFTAQAKVTRDGRQYISLPHSNRIYEQDWGYATNHMGKNGDGQRIAHYSIPLDDWA